MAKWESDSKTEKPKPIAQTNRDAELARRASLKAAQKAAQASEHRPLVRVA